MRTRCKKEKDRVKTDGPTDSFISWKGSQWTKRRTRQRKTVSQFSGCLYKWFRIGDLPSLWSLWLKIDVGFTGVGDSSTCGRGSTCVLRFSGSFQILSHQRVYKKNSWQCLSVRFRVLGRQKHLFQNSFVCRYRKFLFISGRDHITLTWHGDPWQPLVDSWEDSFCTPGPSMSWIDRRRWC